jgi:hypothetical protein
METHTKRGKTHMVRGNIIPKESKIPWNSNLILNAPFMVGTLGANIGDSFKPQGLDGH